MPMYTFECPECGHVTERELKMKDLDTWHGATWCLCGKTYGEEPTLMKRIISKSSFQLKGAGWAKDGYTAPKVKK